MVIERRREEIGSEASLQARRQAEEAMRFGPRILLVEDDAEMRRMLAGLLRRDGYFVTEAADADAALEWLGAGILDGEPTRLPALIVSDVRLPSLSGLDLLAGSRLWPHRIPVVLITGFGDAELHSEARALGAVCVLDKPFPIASLRAAVRFALTGPEAGGPGGKDGHVV